MGADMWIEAIGCKAAANNQIDPDWARSALARARKAIQAIDSAFLARINEDQGNDYPTVGEYKQLLRSDLKDVELAVFEHHRQAATIAGGAGIVLLISGGPSWGDAPTELFQSMFRLQEAAVFPDARWPEPADAPVPDRRD
jgi:hypothetical protein